MTQPISASNPSETKTGSASDLIQLYIVERADGSSLLSASTSLAVATFTLAGAILVLVNDFDATTFGANLTGVIYGFLPLPVVVSAMFFVAVSVAQGRRATSAQRLEIEIVSRQHLVPGSFGLGATEPHFNLAQGGWVTALFSALNYSGAFAIAVGFTVIFMIRSSFYNTTACVLFSAMYVFLVVVTVAHVLRAVGGQHLAAEQFAAGGGSVGTTTREGPDRGSGEARKRRRSRRNGRPTPETD